MGELGDRLRQAREAKGLSLEQLEEITRIRRRYLQALEEEDYGQLPGEVFVRGFLRNYALAVGLDPQEVLAINGYRAPAPARAMDPNEGREPFLNEPLARPSAGSRVVVGLVTVIAIAALAMGGWTLYRYFAPQGFLLRPSASPQPSATLAPVVVQVTPTPSSTQTPLPATPTPTATVVEATEAPVPTEVPQLGVLVRLEATQKTWVHVEVDGALVVEQNMEAGQSREFQGKDKVFLRCGNAGGLRIWYNGQEQSPLGNVGDVVDKTWTPGPLPYSTSSTATPSGESTPGPLGTPPLRPSPSPTGTR